MKRWLVREVMTSDVVSVVEDTPYKEIVGLLADHRVSAVPVLDGDKQVVGVVSEADLMHKLEYSGPLPEPAVFERRRQRVARKRADGAFAEDLMTSPAVTVAASEPVTSAARLMASQRIKRLPVVDDHGHLVGIVSRGDLLRVYLRDDEEILAEIRRDVLQRTLWMVPESIDVSVEDGVVTLTGTLDRRTTVPLVVRLTEGVTGVVAVVSHLTYHFDDTVEPDRRSLF